MIMRNKNLFYLLITIILNHDVVKLFQNYTICLIVYYWNCVPSVKFFPVSCFLRLVQPFPSQYSPKTNICLISLLSLRRRQEERYSCNVAD